MRSRNLLLLLLFVFLISAVPAHAQAQQFKLFESPFMKAFGSWLTTPVQWPPVGQDKEPVAPLQIILVSIALFSIILAVVRTRMAIFQDDRVRHLAAWLALPIVGISVTGTHFVPAIWGIVGFGSDIIPIILFILLIIFAITLTVRGIGASGIRGGPIVQAVGERVGHGAERAANVIRGQAGREERNLAQEAQLFQQLDNLEGAGIRDAVALEGYLNQVINLLGNPPQGGIRQVIQGINERLTRLNAAFGALVAVNARATALDRQLNTTITNETRRLRANMNAVRTTLVGAAASAPAVARITSYTNEIARRHNDARTTSLNLAANGRRLTALEVQIRAGLGTALTTLGNALASRDARTRVAGVRTARTELITVRSLVAELITVMKTIESEAERIRNDLMREVQDLSAEEHLARV